MTNEYKIELTLTTEAKHEVHALNRVKKALREYGDRNNPDQHMKVTEASSKTIVPTHRAGMGSLFRMTGDLYALVSCGMPNEDGGGYVVSRLRDGCWSMSGKVMQDLVERMVKRGAFTLVKGNSGFFCTVWTGKVELEEIKL